MVIYSSKGFKIENRNQIIEHQDRVCRIKTKRKDGKTYQVSGSGLNDGFRAVKVDWQ